MTYNPTNSQLLKATEKASDNAASSAYPSSMIFPSFTSQSSAGEPYLIKTNGKPNKIILYLHSWSADLNQITSQTDLMTIDNAVFIAPNFGGPNNTAGALGSQDSTDRIARVVSEVRYKTGLTRVYLVGPSGGGMASLLLLGRYPNLVYRASIWVPIYDLASLYSQTSEADLKANMVSVIGSAPTSADDSRYLARSPRSCLNNFNGKATVIINVGTSDNQTPKQQGYDARDAMILAVPGSDVSVVEWAMGHEFKAFEAVKQLVLE